MFQKTDRLITCPWVGSASVGQARNDTWLKLSNVDINMFHCLWFMEGKYLVFKHSYHYRGERYTFGCLYLSSLTFSYILKNIKNFYSVVDNGKQSDLY
uniref:Uncharacterized protein n=1 Tax=Anguilla anguilla TaxID=7936 RepID=A0A0E9S1F6_ANGAN